MAHQNTALEDLTMIADEIFERWDADMKPGKLLSALAGRLPNYDPRITRLRQRLEKDDQA